jgi:hypothetical protein
MGCFLKTTCSSSVPQCSAVEVQYAYVDLYCIVPYLILAKSTRLPILVCKITDLAAEPKRTVRYLRTGTIRHCEGRDLGSPRCKSTKFRPSHHLESPRKSYVLFTCAKLKILVQMSISSIFFLLHRMVNPFFPLFCWEPGFPHNFAKNDRHNLKMGGTDASRRQLQSVLEIGV